MSNADISTGDDGRLHFQAKVTLFDLHRRLEEAIGPLGGLVGQGASLLERAAGGHIEMSVRALRGEERVDHLYDFDLEVFAPPHLDLEDHAIGARARLDWRIGDRSRVIHGVVAEVETLGGHLVDDVETERYRMVIRPRAHLMTLAVTSRVFQRQTVMDIVRKVTEPHGVTVLFSLRHHPPPREYCCQYHETDFEFVRRIAAEHGMFFFFEQPASEGESAATNAADAVTTAVGAGIAGGSPDALARGALAGASDLTKTRSREVMVFADHVGAYPAITFDGGQSAAMWLDKIHSQGRALAGVGVDAAADAMGDTPLGKSAGRLLEAGIGELARELGDAPDLHYARGAGALGGDERHSVSGLRQRRALRAEHAEVRLYDPERPGFEFRAQADQPQEEGVVDAVKGLARSALEAGLEALDVPEDLLSVEHPPGIYDHGERYRFFEWDFDKSEPRRALEAANADRELLMAESFCPWLTAGHRFELVDHPRDKLNRGLVVRSVVHEVDPERLGFGYRNRFTCVPDSTLLLSRYPRRRSTALMTGVVVGGAPGTVHTNEMGMVEVRFHWDRSDGDNPSTCWLRVVQPWAGQSWGFQFLPRVGTEVAVAFEGGDPNRPLVVGGLHHRTAPYPFTLPEEWTKSGIRTRTTPTGESGHELVFEDLQERQRIVIHSSRDLEVETERNRTVTIHNDDQLAVEGNRRVAVTGEHVTESTGIHQLRAAGGQDVSVDGMRNVTVTGVSNEQVDGDRTVRVRGNQTVEVEGRRQSRTAGDVIERTAGNLVRLVGSSEGQRSMATRVEGDWNTSATKKVVLEADSELVLRCGDTVLRLSPDQAELSSSRVVVRGEDARALLADGSLKVLADELVQLKAQSVALASSGAGLGLSSEASVSGSRILLNSPGQAEDSVAEDSATPTVIELVDDEGVPVPDQPFRIVLDDGREIGGMTDADGRAELDLSQGGDIFFPGLRGVREV